MKKLLLTLIVLLATLCMSACSISLTGLSENEITKLVCQEITPDMTYDEIFSKLESMGFELTHDMNVVPTQSLQFPSVVFSYKNVHVRAHLNYTVNKGYEHEQITSYKSDKIIINGIGSLVVKVSGSRDETVIIP